MLALFVLLNAVTGRVRAESNELGPSEKLRHRQTRTNAVFGMDNSMLKKNVKFRKQIADKIGVGFELPDSISASIVPNVPKTTVVQAEQVVA